MKTEVKISGFYMKYTIKKPILFLCVAFIGVALFLYMTLKIQVPVNETFKGKAVFARNNEVTITLNKKLSSNKVRKIYMYVNKNVKIYVVNDFKIKDCKIYIVNTRPFFSVIKKHSNITLDIEQKNISLFKKIFVKGGKL